MLFTDEAASPDSSSQTAYIILHASICFVPFSLVFPNLVLYLILSFPLPLPSSTSVLLQFYLSLCLSMFVFTSNKCFCACPHSFIVSRLYFSLTLCVSVHTVNASFILCSNGRITNSQIVTSNSFFFPHSPVSQCWGLCYIIALVLSGRWLCSLVKL